MDWSPSGPVGVAQVAPAKGSVSVPHPVFAALRFPLNADVHAVEFDAQGRPVLARKAERDLHAALESEKEAHRKDVEELKRKLALKEVELGLKGRDADRKDDESEHKMELQDTQQAHSEEMDRLRLQLQESEAARKKILQDHTIQLDRERQALVKEKARNDALQKELDRKQAYDLKLKEMASKADSEEKRAEAAALLKEKELADRKEDRQLRAALAEAERESRRLKEELDRERQTAAEARRYEIEQLKQALDRDRMGLQQNDQQHRQAMAELAAKLQTDKMLLDQQKAEWQKLKDQHEEERKERALQHQEEMDRERIEWAREKAEAEEVRAELTRKQQLELKLMDLASRKEGDTRKGELQVQLQQLQSTDRARDRELRQQLAEAEQQNRNLQQQLDLERKEAADLRKLELEHAKLAANQELQLQKQTLDREVKEAQQALAREQMELAKETARLKAEQIAQKNELDMAKLLAQKLATDRSYEIELKKLEDRRATELERMTLAKAKREFDEKLEAQRMQLEEAKGQHQITMQQLQLEMQRLKRGDQEAVAKAAAEAREAQRLQREADYKAAEQKRAFDMEKQTRDAELQRIRLVFEREKLQREAAQSEAENLRAARDYQLKEMETVWKQMRERVELNLKEGKALDDRRLVEADLEQKHSDQKLATKIAKILAQGALILQDLTHAEDVKDIEDVEMVADGDEEKMNISVERGVSIATVFLGYLQTAAKIVEEINKEAGTMLGHVFPGTIPGNQPKLPRIRDIVNRVNAHIVGLRAEMKEISKERRAEIKEPNEKREAARVFKDGSFVDVIRWFTNAALTDPMANQRIAMWFQKAQVYEARFYVARAVLMAIGVFLKTQTTAPRFAGKDYRGPPLPDGKTPSFEARKDALYSALPASSYGLMPPPSAMLRGISGTQLRRDFSVPRLSRGVSRPEVDMTQATGADSRKAPKKPKKPKKPQQAATAAMTGAGSDEIDAKRAEELQLTIATIVDGIRRQVTKLPRDAMWEDASKTAFGDFAFLQMYTQDWAALIRERFQGIGVQSPEAAVITAVSAALEAFDKAADQVEASFKQFDQRLMISELTKQADRIVDTARKVRSEQDDGFFKINQAIHDACLYWNEFFPFSIIDQLTAGWAAVHGEALDLLTRGGSTEDMYNVLTTYEQTIDTQFLRYNQVLTALPASDTYMRGSPLITRTIKEVDRHLAIDTQRESINKTFQLWYNEASVSEANARKVFRAITVMTEELTHMVGTNVPPINERFFSGSPFLARNVEQLTNWLKEWQDAARDGYKVFQDAYKKLAQASTALSSSDAARNLEQVFTQDLTQLVKAADVITVSVADLKGVKDRVAERLKEWRDVLKKALNTQGLLAQYTELESRNKAFLVPYLDAAESWTSAAVTHYLDTMMAVAQDKLAKDLKKKNKAGDAKGALDPEGAPMGSQLAMNNFTLVESSHPTWRFAKVLEFVKLLSGSVPVVPDSIIDMSVVLVGHPEVRKEAAFAHLTDGVAEKETAALRLLDGAALSQFEREKKSLPSSDAFGLRDSAAAAAAEAEEKLKEDAEETDNMRVARIGEAILQRIDALRDMLADTQRFDEALLGIMTPYGAACVLSSWHMLQKSSRRYEKRSLAQMICAADLRIRSKFAQFCANQYNATDKRRPTRHAHGIDFANEINVEYDTIGKFLITQVRCNPAVRDADDCTASPWIICRTTRT